MENGYNIDQISRDSFLRLRDVVVVFPRAATTNYIVASVDPSGVSEGGSLTLAATASGLQQRFGRKATITATDASGGSGGLSLTVTIRGYRLGVYQEENVTVTCTDGNPTTATSTKVFDQFVAPLLRTKTNAASGDALVVGIDGATIGLPFRINSVNSVKMINDAVSGTESTNQAISSSTVDVDNSAIIGQSLAATKVYHIIAEMDGSDGWNGFGVLQL